MASHGGPTLTAWAAVKVMPACHRGVLRCGEDHAVGPGRTRPATGPVTPVAHPTSRHPDNSRRDAAPVSHFNILEFVTIELIVYDFIDTIMRLLSY
jgi:hypothetical protein